MSKKLIKNGNFNSIIYKDINRKCLVYTSYRVYVAYNLDGRVALPKKLFITHFNFSSHDMMTNIWLPQFNKILKAGKVGIHNQQELPNVDYSIWVDTDTYMFKEGSGVGKDIGFIKALLGVECVEQYAPNVGDIVRVDISTKLLMKDWRGTYLYEKRMKHYNGREAVIKKIDNENDCYNNTLNIIDIDDECHYWSSYFLVPEWAW